MVLSLVCPRTTSRIQPLLYQDGWFFFKCDHNAEYALQLEAEAGTFRPIVTHVLAEYARIGTLDELARHAAYYRSNLAFHGEAQASARHLAVAYVQHRQQEAQDVSMGQLQSLKDLLHTQQQTYDTWKADFEVQLAQLRDSLTKSRLETSQARSDAARKEQEVLHLQDELAAQAHERQQMELALDNAQRELASRQPQAQRTPPPVTEGAYRYPDSVGDVSAAAHNVTSGTTVTQSGTVLRMVPFNIPGYDVPLTPQHVNYYQKGLGSGEKDWFDKALPSPSDPNMDVLDMMTQLFTFMQHLNAVTQLPDLLMLSENVVPSKRAKHIAALGCVYGKGTLLAGHKLLKVNMLRALPSELK